MGETDSNSGEKLSCSARMKRVLTGANGALFIAFTMSKWGDWMWFFASGLLLVYLDNGLQLTAIFGFSSGGAMLLFGGLIGSWVDKTSRITAVRVSLVIQNISVTICAVVVCVALEYRPQLEDLLGEHFVLTRDITIIFFAVIGNLASMGYSIAITRDWIVVLADGNKSKLATLNAATRTIHLACQILAPTFVGLLMTAASMFVAAATIASWNVLSVAIEYLLLSRVYRLCPALRQEKGASEAANEEKDGDAEVGVVAVELQEKKPAESKADSDDEDGTADTLLENGQGTAGEQSSSKADKKEKSTD